MKRVYLTIILAALSVNANALCKVTAPDGSVAFTDRCGERAERVRKHAGGGLTDEQITASRSQYQKYLATPSKKTARASQRNATPVYVKRNRARKEKGRLDTLAMRGLVAEGMTEKQVAKATRHNQTRDQWDRDYGTSKHKFGTDGRSYHFDEDGKLRSRGRWK